jgi:dipeptidyl aminopeptidase/acylaminoacyl peptidase
MPSLTTHAPALPRGGDLSTKLKEHIIGSPLYWVTPQAAPTLCIHGTEDPYVAFEQAMWIVDKLKAAQVEAKLLPIQGAGHGFKKPEDAATAEQALIDFFDSQLKGGE